MDVNDIIERAYIDRQRWHSKGYRKGKFILGVEIENELLSNSTCYNKIDGFRRTFMGFDYVTDTQNPQDINFCPIEE